VVRVFLDLLALNQLDSFFVASHGVLHVVDWMARVAVQQLGKLGNAHAFCRGREKQPFLVASRDAASFVRGRTKKRAWGDTARKKHRAPVRSLFHQRRRPRRPPFLRVVSVGIGVTSSIRPIFIPARAKARSALWAPGPGCLDFVPPVARILI
jgi:hypothetical protein